ncbi:MAG: malto-oligosyltrehalose synthase [Bacteroidales bacterium]|nr:malto-oligosyltrehalose synthase [Bacteroidales bacterium]
MHRFVCIHAHFAQPPRENPWLEEIETEDLADPFHDWNERVCAESYAPNAVARIMNPDGEITELVNNYARISFSFGPILLAWLERKEPAVYAAIMTADRESRDRFGRGSALAQPYAHPILPLLSARDRTTVIRWGLADFERRFGRKAEGMWLPETAVDHDTLDTLAAEGIRFTLLAPHQAKQIRKCDEVDWQSADTLDTTRPYLCRLSSGRTITIFFFDGGLSEAVSSGRVLHNGEVFAERLLSGFGEDDSRPHLVHIATDGELYGHRHKHGDMALAFALHRLAEGDTAHLTNYPAFLADHPAEYEVEIQDRTALTSTTGLDRWTTDGGGNSGFNPRWHQRWRAPMRAAFDWLATEIDQRYEQAAQSLVSDPWAARNGYPLPTPGQSPDAWTTFLGRYARPGLTTEEEVLLRRWLEAQRHRLMMFASFGWHFDDIACPEPRYVQLQAIRAARLVDALTGHDATPSLEAGLVERLALAPGNRPETPDGGAVYEKLLSPQIVTWPKLAANYAMLSLFDRAEPVSTLYAFRITQVDYRLIETGKVRTAVGRARFRSLATGETTEFSFAAVHFGDHNVSCGVRRTRSDSEFRDLTRSFQNAAVQVHVPELVRLLDREFGPDSYSLGTLFRDQQRKVLKQVSRSQLADAATAYARVFEQQLPLVKFLQSIGEPPPRAFAAAAGALFNTDLAWALADDDPDWQTIARLFREADEYGAHLETAGLGYKFARLLARVADRWHEEPDSLERLESLLTGARLARGLSFDVGLWRPQNVYVDLLHGIAPDIMGRATTDSTARSWLDAFVELGDELNVHTGSLKQDRDTLQTLPTVEDVVHAVAKERRVPTATYRLQMHAGFTFHDAINLVPYLAELGVSDLYLSPILMARPGSLHGYDVTDHSRMNPELGPESDFDALAETARAHGLGIVLDVVPNHMCVAHASNRWWMDILENGIGSKFSAYFDIDWYPVNPSLNEKVLLPILGDQYGTILESGQLKLGYEDGGFHFDYWETRVPLAPRTSRMILEHRLDDLDRKLGVNHPDVLELRSILTALHHLPPRTELSPAQVEERYREKAVIRRRIRDLLVASGDIRSAIEASLAEINGTPGKPETFDLLDQLVEGQSFRPAFWRVSTEEINYRRFFDINELAAIRVEDPDVFRDTHQLIVKQLATGKANGLRVDHPDGLKDPTQYFRRLQEEYVIARVLDRLRLTDGTEAAETVRQTVAKADIGTPLFVVAEKILSEAEPLPNEWDVAGTTGYDFLNAANGLFVASGNREMFNAIYHAFLDRTVNYHELLHNCKNLIMRISMASEINSLSHQLDRISERNRRYRDFTLNALRHVIREVIASLSVYRTYIVPGEPMSARDRRFVEQAVADANRRNPQAADALFDFVRDTVLLENLETFREPDRPAVLEWAARFQQLTGPIMAKGVEDTAFYVFNRFVSLNEVGGHPDVFGVSIADFHRFNAARVKNWPHTMSAGSTHDTKRSEDVRARLNVLSELPEEWASAVIRWREHNLKHVTSVEEQPAPDPNDEYFLYQTLVGVWPTGATAETFTIFRKRMVDYTLKAVKEGKVRTSWVNPNEEYDAAIRRFVEQLLPDDPTAPFRTDVEAFVRRIEIFGYINSLSQTALRLTCPGVPDVYQGTEFWDFSLVDPDNRRPVDYGIRRATLAQVESVTAWPSDWSDPATKLFLTRKLLRLRKEHSELFLSGEYTPLVAQGTRVEHLCAFARSMGSLTLVMVVPRLLYTLTGGDITKLMRGDIWEDTVVQLPPGVFADVCTGRPVVGPLGRVADLFADGPLAVLLSDGTSRGSA